MADGEVEVETKKEQEEQEEKSDEIKECKPETQEIIQEKVQRICSNSIISL